MSEFDSSIRLCDWSTRLPCYRLHWAIDSTTPQVCICFGLQLWSRVFNSISFCFIFVMDGGIGLPPTPRQLEISNGEIPHDQSRRKRRRIQENDPTTSSDAAWFSSDERAPSAEAYTSQRRKKRQWKGTWWGGKEEQTQAPVTSTTSTGKRRFTRNLDSGVWMASDDTQSSFDDNVEALDSFSGSRRRSPDPTSDLEVEDESHRSSPALAISQMDGQSFVSQVDATVSTGPLLEHQQAPFQDERVDEILQTCLEAGSDCVDLSGLDVQVLPAGSISSLKGLIKHEKIFDNHSDEESYGPIESKLELYLGNNSLTRFPPDILEFSHLRILSLRHNQLRTLPPSIGGLANLHYLHVGCNELRYLPIEILQLQQNPGFRLVAHPNPLMSPVGGFPETKDSEPSHMTRWPAQARAWKRSKPSFFYADGLRVKDDQFCRSTSPPKVHTLIELALRKLTDPSELAEFKEWCDVGEGPQMLSGALEAAQDAKMYGRNKCTICKREFIVRRAEWIEFHHSPWKQSPAVPFLRQGCSWSCVLEPDPAQEVLLAE